MKNNKIADEARAEFLEGTNQTGILIIHGFTGSTQSMRNVAYKLHILGYTINMPRLEGHGTTPEDMESTNYQDWVESVNKAYEELESKVKSIFVLGLSMGGTLSLYCAINHKISGAITVNAAINLPNFRKLYENPELPRFMEGIGSDIKKEGVKEWAYTHTPKKSIEDILTLTDIVRKDLDKVVCPILIFKSLDDHVVPPYNQDYIFSNVNSHNKELIELKNSYHVATLDNDWELIVEKAEQFIKDNS